MGLVRWLRSGLNGTAGLEIGRITPILPEERSLIPELEIETNSPRRKISYLRRLASIKHQSALLFNKPEWLAARYKLVEWNGIELAEGQQPEVPLQAPGSGAASQLFVKQVRWTRLQVQQEGHQVANLVR